MPSLAIYTSSFPFGFAETFLETEITFLSSHFDTIYIIPFSGNGKQRKLPANVIVLPCIQKKKWPVLTVYFTGLLHLKKLFNSHELKRNLSFTPFLKGIKYLGLGILTKNNISRILPKDVSLYYSYWLTYSAFALALQKSEGMKFKLVSRAHGYDLYEERAEKSLKFIKRFILNYMDKLVLISEHGKIYIEDKFPEFSEKYLVSRLGTANPLKLNPVNNNSFLTIVSCSGINPNKRVNLIFEALNILQKKNPSKEIYWYHFGTGKTLPAFIEKTELIFKCSQIHCIFKGQVLGSELYNFYSSVPLDIFINVSENEGLPVSIMEAQSFSIPVIATNVGGSSEIVNDENGLLLNPNLNSDELAEIINNIYDTKETWKLKRQFSRKNWEDNFNASRNYSSFSNFLHDLAESGSKV
jgi:glycosyltransferase involved in cell wall biosynthesis